MTILRGAKMQKTLLREIVLEQEQNRQSVETGTTRTVLNSISKYIALPHTVVISGIRRCGKSTLLNQIANSFYKEGIYYLNLGHLLFVWVKMTKKTYSTNILQIPPQQDL